MVPVYENGTVAKCRHAVFQEVRSVCGPGWRTVEKVNRMGEFAELECLHDEYGVPTVRVRKNKLGVWVFDKYFAWYKGDPSDEVIIEVLDALNKGVLD